MDAVDIESFSGDSRTQLLCPTVINRQLKFPDGDRRLIERRCAKWKLPPTHFTQFTIDTIFLGPIFGDSLMNTWYWTLDNTEVKGQSQMIRNCEETKV